MQNVLLVVHLIACIALVIAVMLQRSEGGALGMGGGGTGGVISGRGAANVLVRTTMILAAVFFVTSIVMTRLNAEEARAPTDLDRQLQQQQNIDPLAPGAPVVAAPPVVTAPTITAPDPLAPAIAPPAPAPAPAPVVTTPQPDPLAPATTTPATTLPTTPPTTPDPTPNP